MSKCHAARSSLITSCRAARRALTTLLLSASLGACYRVTPLTTPLPSTGREVVVELTDAGAVQLTPSIGARIERVRGAVSEASDTRLVLLMRGATDRTGTERPWAGERVEVPREYIASMRERRFDGMRSALLTALVVGGVILAGGILGGGGALGGIWGGGGGSRQ